MVQLVSGSADRPAGGAKLHTVELDISGMTCAACAARVEKKLNKIGDDVYASVNYATEKATVVLPTGITVDELISTVEKAGYGAQLPAEEETTDETFWLKLRLIIAVLFSVPVIAISMVPVWQFSGWQWLAWGLSTVVVWWCGFGFHKAALANARHGGVSMDTLISIGTSAAYFWSVYALLFGGAGEIGLRHEFSFTLRPTDGLNNIYFEAACGIIMFLLLGRYLEARSKKEAGAALRALLEVGAKQATILRDGQELKVPIKAVGIDDEFVSYPGEKIATDGVVTAGSAAINASLMTGESVPVDVGVGDSVIGGTINTNGRLVVRATAIGADTQLAHIAKLLEKAQTAKAEVQRLADKVSGIFVPLVIVIAVIVFIAWLLYGARIGFAFTAAVAVLIIACPCALGLATPMALLVGTGWGAQHGIVISGAPVLETAKDIDTVILDKTGTITTGQMAVVKVAPHNVGSAELLALAGAVESSAEHPIAAAIVSAAQQLADENDRIAQFIDRLRSKTTNFKVLPGMGLRAEVEGKELLAGSAQLLAGVPDFDAVTDATAVYLSWDNVYLGYIELADTVKSTSKQAIELFKELNMTPVLVSGDSKRVASQVAAEIGIDNVLGEALPEDKVAYIQQLQQAGRKVAMVGDGVNDAAALAQADLGLAMGDGTDVAIAASDITLTRPDLVLAADAIRLSRQTLATIKANLFWAFVYNGVAIPVAAFGLLNPMLAGAAMAFSSVFVVFNSLMLRRFELTPVAKTS